MNRLIGITGGMSSGKTTVSKEIIKYNPNYIYIDVDNFRRNLYQNEKYIIELKKIIPELNKYKDINSNILNKYIFTNKIYMYKYKKLMYKYLFNHINKYNNKTILIEWALILNDNLQDYFEKIIYVRANIKTRMHRLKNSDLKRTEILTRFKLQEIDNIEKYNSDNLLIIDNDFNFDINTINNFLNGMECKFTLPNNEGKAIWEITHQCNYSCSYCIFSCNSKKIENELSTKECFHIIDELVKHGFRHLKITGGEPFLRKDILEILKYASSKLVTDVSTNASLITEKTIEELNKIDLKMIHVSLDGNKYEHESVRGKNTYERTITGIKALKKSKNKIRIGTVIHYNNQSNLENLVKEAQKLQGNEIIFSIMEPVANQDKSLIKTSSNEKLKQEIERLKEKYKSDIIVNYNFGKQPIFIRKCPAGDKFIYINNLGQISPCPWLHEKDKTCISNKSLRNNTLESIFKEEKLSIFLSSKKEGKCYGKI